MGVFRFKQFEIEQRDSVFKIGTDGLLIATWVDVNSPQTVLDIGTGTGLIALVLAQRFSQASIQGIDLNPDAIQLANLNFEASPWKERLTANDLPYQNLIQEQFDLIITNPPFFDKRLKSGKKTKDWARHNDSLPFESIILQTKKLLSPEGTFAIILPTDEFTSFEQLAIQNQLFPKRICTVQGNPNSSIKRYMAEFGHQEVSVKKEALIVEQSRHVYTEEYISLTKDFLLKL